MNIKDVILVLSKVYGIMAALRELNDHDSFIVRAASEAQNYIKNLINECALSEKEVKENKQEEKNIEEINNVK